MSSFFGGNPFATTVGHRIEQATDAALASENWALNMEICDIINETEDGPKDAIRAIRKKLQQNAGKNYTVVMYALIVLETCVKNCGKRFHILSCNKEFVQELVKLIGPKNDPPTAVQEKVLSLIQSWADAFRHQPELSGVVSVYNDLKLKGIEFPMTDLDTMAPIHTPQRSVPESETIAARAPSPRGAGDAPMPMARVAPTVVATSPSQGAVPTPAVVGGSVMLSAEQLAKLRSELDVVQGNMSVLSEMLSELTPGKEHPSDLELLQELHATCKAMQQRLMELIGKVSNDEITAELLRINDELNNLFLRYSRFEKNREPNSQSAAVTLGSQTTNEKSLIDLDDEPTPSLNAQLAGLALGATGTAALPSKISSVPARTAASSQPNEDSEFDMFAQSRNVTYESTKQGGSTYKDNLDPDQIDTSLGAVTQTRSKPMHDERDFDEMAAWLDGKPPDVQAGREESVTSSEFDRFLAERAAAAEALPTLPSPPTTAPSSGGGSRSTRRQLEKDEAENSLFAL